MQDADLRSAKLGGAQLVGADLRGARYGHGTVLTSICTAQWGRPPKSEGLSHWKEREWLWLLLNDGTVHRPPREYWYTPECLPRPEVEVFEDVLSSLARDQEFRTKLAAIEDDPDPEPTLLPPERSRYVGRRSAYTYTEQALNEAFRLRVRALNEKATAAEAAGDAAGMARILKERQVVRGAWAFAAPENQPVEPPVYLNDYVGH
jgi:hypothetical protein